MAQTRPAPGLLQRLAAGEGEERRGARTCTGPSLPRREGRRPLRGSDHSRLSGSMKGPEVSHPSSLWGSTTELPVRGTAGRANAGDVRGDGLQAGLRG